MRSYLYAVCEPHSGWGGKG